MRIRNLLHDPALSLSIPAREVRDQAAWIVDHEPARLNLLLAVPGLVADDLHGAGGVRCLRYRDAATAPSELKGAKSIGHVEYVLGNPILEDHVAHVLPDERFHVRRRAAGGCNCDTDCHGELGEWSAATHTGLLT